MTRQLVACFHGGGSNASIFELQCIRLQNALPNVEFIYFDAPYECNAGPGVLPFFDEFAPFRTWFKLDGNQIQASDGNGYDDRENDGIQRVWNLMLQEKDTKPEDWVAVMGFSQGTRVAGGLLLDQQRRLECGEPHHFNIKFGVMCMGVGEPMRRSSASINDGCATIRLPTIHLHGLKDVFLPGGRVQLANHFKPESTTLYEIEYNHAMPWIQSEIYHLADLIKQQLDRRSLIQENVKE